MVSFLTDSKGRRKAAVIPIKEWEALERKRREDEIYESVRQGAIEVKAMIDAGVQGKSWGEVMKELNEEG